MTALDAKLAHLRALLGALPSALVAFSGGVDSSFLLCVAHDVLGPRCVALTTRSGATPAEDLESAQGLAASLGVTHVLVDTDELRVPGYAENPSNRCYFCKDHLFAICAREASARGLAAVLDGANVDDLADHRPGLAAAAERRVLHPLVDAGFTKAEVREASRGLGLATWDRPASPCLSSRFPYGTRITAERLERIAAAERCLRAQGLRELRVRFHDAVARIEVPPAAMPRLLDPVVRETVVREFRRLGFTWVTLDLAGFRSGSLDAVLRASKHEGPEG
ncbi:MAG TPA: ATP-dependent sacrificial sulfur transferase LarE [Candidatus Binatia bacterium]|nr:ATP-dependent sacrificial sulfur transferase LarE [Candidatus Binatia bacterium]